MLDDKKFVYTNQYKLAKYNKLPQTYTELNNYKK